MFEPVRAITFRGFREYVQELGGDADLYLRMTGLEPWQLADGDAYVPFSSVARAFEITALALNRPDFGMRFGIRQEPAVTGPLALAIANATTARDGVACAVRFVRFHNRALELSIEPAFAGHEIIAQQLNFAHPVAHTQAVERVVAFMYNVIGRFGGDEFAATEVWFTHQPLSPPEIYRDVFGATPRFGKPRNGIVVATPLLDAVRPGRSKDVHELAVAYLERLSPAETTSIEARVRTALELMMRSGDGSQVEVARALGMHERTLQRRLKDEGAVFETIKDEIRRERAAHYLARRKLPLSHVAELLGYAEPSALSRSCRRWFGASPRDIRKRLAA